jgi:hypothetical protein
MFGHHTLGPARRSRSVEHVAEIDRGDAGLSRRQSGCAALRDVCGVFIPVDQRTAEDAADPDAGRLFADQQTHLGLLENIAQAVVGMRRVERHIGRARFEAGEQSDDRPFGTLQAEPDDGAGTNAEAAQMMGQAIGLRFHGCIAEFARAADEREAGAGFVGAGLEEFMQTACGVGLAYVSGTVRRCRRGTQHECLPARAACRGAE